ncbi:hypothetical protein PR202_gb24590 [Eleusine coracana subsp. coracana]|uniref:Uncharacterized protein n=1 Tax=Eleusine coracana subsp. coracana TaxID=191504 RepID=A0AAV5FM16_ELECO|nr:hypothetical protein QOZ80_5BG0450190 [Eleusine coracana subsp. coracana]GJN35783.1 hypothetical protein PR202_gb24590 [Eleusine coracana subsp. coracana]
MTIGKKAALFGLVLLCAVLCHGAMAQRYNAIYSFGDSISDAGNLCVGGCPSWLTTGQSPYGMTFFHRPTGRCSDGRVIVDFLAEHFGLPLPPASKAGGDFKKGANMAIIGATTMNFDFFQSIGLSDKIWNNGPLDTQIQWFRQILPSVCGKDCKNYLSKSLFVVGEFGGNDYNAALFSGRTMAEVRGYVPKVVSKLIRGIETIIRTGATDVVVPGVLPIGCFPIYLTLYGTSNAADYDGDGCLKSYNGLSSYHNSLLKRSLSNLQRTYPHARIMYADFYSQVIHMIRAPQNFGLKYGLKVCCGAGGQGKYNYNNKARCGMAGSSACADPGNYLIWDGIHLTEAAYRSIADGWLKGTYCNPAILH